MECQIDYDKESDDLFIFANQKSKGSVEIGDLILDLDRKGDIVGIEILHATKFLSDCTDDKNISRDILSHLAKCYVDVKKRSNFLFIKLILEGKNISIPCSINAPAITETSPALTPTL